MDPGRSKDQPTSGGRRRNVIPAQSTTSARGGHGSSSSQATQSRDDAEAAGAAGALLGMSNDSGNDAEAADAAGALLGISNDPGSVGALQTTAGQPMMPPAGALNATTVQVKPTDEERKICTERGPDIKRMFRTAWTYVQMGHVLGVRPGAVKWMWKKELGMDNAEATEARHRLQINASLRRLREKAKASKSGESEVADKGPARKIESSANKPL